MPALDFAQIGISGAQLMNVAFWSVILISLTIIGGIIVWFFAVIARYNIKVEIEERRGDAIVEYTTRGGIILNKKTKLKDFVVWRKKSNMFNTMRSNVPDNNHFRMTNKGKRKLRIYKDGVDTYKIIPPIQDDGSIPKPVDLDWYNWASLTLKSHAPRFRNEGSFLKDNAGVIGLYGVMFLLLVIVIVGFQKFTDISGNIAATASANTKTMESLERAQVASAGIQRVKPLTETTVIQEEAG